MADRESRIDAPAKSYSTSRHERLPFSSLAKHLEKQVRGSTNGSTVNAYRKAMMNGERFPPLSVAEVNGALILIDGFHRRVAYEALGFDEAEVEITPCASLDEAEWLAFQANMRHGLPLKGKAYRPAFRSYIRAGKHIGPTGKLQSYREIAGALVSVSYSTVRRWTEADFPNLFSAMAGGMDEADGGLRERCGLFAAEQELTLKALDLLDDASALMEGVSTPDLKRRVVKRTHEIALLLELSIGEEELD